MQRRIVTFTVVLLLLASAPFAVATDGDSLRLLLLGVQDQNTPRILMRAELAIELDVPPAPTRKTEAIALFHPGKEARWYFQLREPSLQALVLGTERKVMERTGQTTKTVPMGAPIDALGISYEDLSRFILSDFQTTQITDENRETILVGMHPAVESAYVYRAYTIDKDKKVFTRAQFYAKTLNNLVKLRVDGDHVLFGKQWFPATIALENYPDNSRIRMKLRWSQNAAVPPELFAPASFAGTSPLPWPPPSPTGGMQSPSMQGAATSPEGATTPAGASKSPAAPAY